MSRILRGDIVLAELNSIRGLAREERSVRMARKIRELIQDLKRAGFYEIPGSGKGSHRKFTHVKYAGAVTLSGKSGDDAKPYQERQVKQAIEEVNK